MVAPRLRKLKSPVLAIVTIMAIFYTINDMTSTKNSFHEPDSYVVSPIETVPENWLKYQPFQSNNLSDWECANERRVNHLRSMCHLRRGDISYHHARLIQDARHNLVYCEVSKAGCTTVKSIWIEANQRPPGSRVMNVSNLRVRGDEAHKSWNLEKAGLQLQKVNQWTDQFEGSIKFITVRHPYDRLVSAYYNLIYWKPGAGDALPYLTSHFKPLVAGDLQTLTFTQFLTVIMDRTLSVYQDRHWKPFTESCYVCHIEYQYILKTETLYRDMTQITRLLGHPDIQLVDIQMNAYKRDTDTLRDRTVTVGTHAGWTKHLPEFENVPRRLRRAIAQRFGNDMDMFGYHFDDKTNLASCLYDTKEDGRSNCC